MSSNQKIFNFIYQTALKTLKLDHYPLLKKQLGCIKFLPLSNPARCRDLASLVEEKRSIFNHLIPIRKYRQAARGFPWGEKEENHWLGLNVIFLCLGGLLYFFSGQMEKSIELLLEIQNYEKRSIRSVELLLALAYHFNHEPDRVGSYLTRLSIRFSDSFTPQVLFLGLKNPEKLICFIDEHLSEKILEKDPIFLHFYLKALKSRCLKFPLKSNGLFQSRFRQLVQPAFLIHQANAYGFLNASLIEDYQALQAYDLQLTENTKREENRQKIEKCLRKLTTLAQKAGSDEIDLFALPSPLERILKKGDRSPFSFCRRWTPDSTESSPNDSPIYPESKSFEYAPRSFLPKREYS